MRTENEIKEKINELQETLKFWENNSAMTFNKNELIHKIQGYIYSLEWVISE